MLVIQHGVYSGYWWNIGKRNTAPHSKYKFLFRYGKWEEEAEYKFLFRYGKWEEEAKYKFLFRYGKW
jgi:hypothetical protein